MMTATGNFDKQRISRANCPGATSKQHFIAGLEAHDFLAMRFKIAWAEIVTVPYPFHARNELITPVHQQGGALPGRRRKGGRLAKPGCFGCLVMQAAAFSMNGLEWLQ